MRTHIPIAAAVLARLPPAAASSHGTIRGTVHAPAGEDVRGAVVVTCFAENGRCDYAGRAGGMACNLAMFTSMERALLSRIRDLVQDCDPDSDGDDRGVRGT